MSMNDLKEVVTTTWKRFILEKIQPVVVLMIWHRDVYVYY